MVYLLLGSNVGSREHNIQAACDMIGGQVGTVSARSAIYETEPWGGVEQASFLNQAIAVTTTLPPLELLKQLKVIEKAVGRVETVQWGPRVIDIDIMLMDGLVYDTEQLTIPQRHLENRRFALVPLAEIAPNVVHPVLNHIIEQLLEACGDNTWVKKWGSQE